MNLAENLLQTSSIFLEVRGYSSILGACTWELQGRQLRRYLHFLDTKWHARRTRINQQFDV